MLGKLKTFKKEKTSSGFTIIEVMIVLAIAGLILLIVFLAVPALQRNSRNTSRKSDVAALLAAVSEYESNNNGALPAACSSNNPVQFGALNAGSQAKVGYYNSGCSLNAPTNGHVQLLTSFAVTGPLSAANQDYVVIVPAATCAGGAATAGGARAIAAVYEIESGSGGYQPVCQES